MSASTKKKDRIASREAGTDKKAQAMKEEAAKKAKEKKIWIFCGVLVAVVLIAVLFLSSPLAYRNTAALRIGDETFSPAQVNYNYANQYHNFASQYGDYASYFGLDTQYGLSGLKSQECGMMENGTWRDYFIDQAASAMNEQKALREYAAENGVVLEEDDLNGLEEEFATLREYAGQNGYNNLDKFFSANYGTGVNEKIAREQYSSILLASKAAQHYQDSLEYTPEEISEKYESYNGDKDYFDLCTYYVMAEMVTDEEGNSAATDETIAAAKAKADSILAEYNSEDLAEETDIELRLNEALARAGVEAECTHSERSLGSNISSYKDWAMKAKEGDATVAESSSSDGYYVVAFIGRDNNNYKLAQVRHILVNFETDEEGNVTDEAKAAAKTEAERIYNEWKSGEATEESFAALAEEYSEDTGSNTNGGLYDNVQKGQMVEAFDAFCFGGHKSGDTAVIETEYGYHVMYYVGEGEICKDYIAKTDLSTEASETWLEELNAKYTPEKLFWIRFVG